MTDTFPQDTNVVRLAWHTLTGGAAMNFANVKEEPRRTQDVDSKTSANEPLARSSGWALFHSQMSNDCGSSISMSQE